MPLCTTLEDLLGGRRVVQQGRMERLACQLFLQVGGFRTACQNGQDTSVCLWRMLSVRKDALAIFLAFTCLGSLLIQPPKEAFRGHLELDPYARKRLPSKIYGSRHVV